MNKFVAEATIDVNATPEQVWEALTKPELIKQYLFGTDVSTDWEIGSPITYKGIWEGKNYEDKGKILEIERPKLIVSTFWSSLGGKPDLPPSYNTVRYEIEPKGDLTTLKILQDNNETQEEADHSKRNWEMVLSELKKLLEKT